LAEKVPLVIEILAKQHRGSFLWYTLYMYNYSYSGTSSHNMS